MKNGSPSRELKQAASGVLLPIPPEPKRECRSCRWWDMHSIDMKAGDCRAPGDHRYSRVPLETRRPDGSVYRSYALLDSFGPETTLPGFVCGVWDDGYREARAKVLGAPTASPAGRPSQAPEAISLPTEDGEG